MLRDFCLRIRFPDEAVDALERAEHTILIDESHAALMAQAVREFPMDPERAGVCLQTVSEESGLHRYTVDMVMLIRAASTLRVEYALHSIPESVFWDTMIDLRCKLMECHQVYGVWGTFVLHWYEKVYRCAVLKLGRLEFEPKTWDLPDYHNCLRSGGPVWHCHIPSCGPCTPEDVIDSLRRAYVFFGIADRPVPILPVACSSWILYPPHLPLLPENGNLRKFAELFHVISYKEREFSNFWRIFGRLPVGSFADLPVDTTLRRQFADYLREGGKMGTGLGVLLFDGEKILPAE